MDWKKANECWLVCYGEAEIAQILGVTRSAVSHMRRRGNCFLPEEDVHLRMGPLWFPETIHPWLVDEIESRYLLTEKVHLFDDHANAAAEDVRAMILDADPDWSSLASSAMTTAFATNMTRAKHLGVGVKEWREALLARHAKDRHGLLDALDSIEEGVLRRELWPW